MAELTNEQLESGIRKLQAKAEVDKVIIAEAERSGLTCLEVIEIMSQITFDMVLQINDYEEPEEEVKTS
jgi:hypothetical protein